MAKKGLIFGAVAVALAGVGAIGVATVRRDAASASEAHIRQAPQPLPLLTTSDAPPESNAALSARIDALNAKVARTPGDAALWKQIGTVNLQATRYDAAVTAYNKALALDPKDSTAWSALGESYTHAITSATSKMPAQAREAFNKALSLNPSDVRAHFYITLEKDYSGQHDEAVGDWLALLRTVPAGSGPDTAIRAAILASLNRNIRLVSVAVEQARQAQPKATTKPL